MPVPGGPVDGLVRSRAMALWSPHQSVTRAGPGALAAGAAFDQQISLGFPIGTTTEHVTIAELEPALRAAWAGKPTASGAAKYDLLLIGHCRVYADPACHPYRRPTQDLERA